MIYSYEKFIEILDMIYFNNKDEKKYQRYLKRNSINYNFDTDY
jgi:hypothetical protein